MDFRKEALDLIDIQSFLNYTIIGTLLVSLIINYNEKLRISGQDPFWDPSTVRDISILLRTILLGVAIVSVYITYRGLILVDNIPSSSEASKKAARLQLISACIGIVVAVIVLYSILIVNPNENETDSIFNSIF